MSASPPPFPSAEAAWFATARRGGAPAAATVLRCLDGLYRRRRIDLTHAHILRIWGARGRAPDPARPRERSDWRIWREAMDRLDHPLRRAGLVNGVIDGLLDAAPPVD